nr:RecName: Full=Peptide 7629 [Tityus stigmurus]
TKCPTCQNDTCSNKI